MQRLSLVAFSMFLVAAAWADNGERCARLFREQSAVDSCVSMLKITPQQLSDSELREKISQMLYGKSAAESDADISLRLQAREQEKQAEEKKIKQTQCGRLFNNPEEFEACRTLSMITMSVRTDIQMIDAVRERLGKPAIRGAERQAVIDAEGTRQEAFAVAQREREKVEAANKARREKVEAANKAKRESDLVRQRAVTDKNSKLPIPDSWRGFEASSNPEDSRLVTAIKKAKWWNVCRDYGREMRSNRESRRFVALREYLVSGGFINGVDLMNIREQRVAVGMTTCGVFAAIGLPNDINQTTTARSGSSQLVYRERRMYVYTEAGPNDGNGIVRTIQH